VPSKKPSSKQANSKLFSSDKKRLNDYKKEQHVEHLKDKTRRNLHEEQLINIKLGDSKASGSK